MKAVLKIIIQMLILLIINVSVSFIVYKLYNMVSNDNKYIVTYIGGAIAVFISSISIDKITDIS